MQIYWENVVAFLTKSIGLTTINNVICLPNVAYFDIKHYVRLHLLEVGILSNLIFGTNIGLITNTSWLLLAYVNIRWLQLISSAFTPAVSRLVGQCSLPP